MKIHAQMSIFCQACSRPDKSIPYSANENIFENYSSVTNFNFINHKDKFLSPVRHIMCNNYKLYTFTCILLKCTHARTHPHTGAPTHTRMQSNMGIIIVTFCEKTMTIKNPHTDLCSITKTFLS